MKKTIAKILVLALAVCMLVPCFASCNKDNGDNDGAFKIGATGPLTGTAASYGQSVQNGAKLAVKHLNAEDGLKFEFKILDDKATAEDAATNFATLLDWGMQLSLGGVTSGSGQAFATAADANGIFCMTPSGSADDVINGMDYSFRLCFGDPDQGVLAANKIKEAGYTKVGAIYDSSDTYSEGIYKAFEDKMDELGISYIETSFDNENNKVFTTQADALKDCDVIFMPFYYTEAALFIKAAVDKQCDAVFFGCDGFDGIADKVEDVNNKIMYITPFDVNSSEKKVQDFVKAYKDEYGTTPDQFAADAYDVVMVLAAALEKEGVEDYDLSAQEIGDILVDVITDKSFSYDGLTGDGMTWDKSGKCTKAPKIVELN